MSAESLSTWAFRAKQVVETPVDIRWLTGVSGATTTGEVVGRAGFHAAPDADGMVEIGYAVDPAYRRRGYARAALEALMERASRTRRSACCGPPSPPTTPRRWA